MPHCKTFSCIVCIDKYTISYAHNTQTHKKKFWITLKICFVWEKIVYMFVLIGFF